MDPIGHARALLKKSSQLATMCQQNPSVEPKLWKLACSYVTHAKELLANSKQWDKLTPIEAQILHDGIPQPLQPLFAESDQQQQQQPIQPPPPSTWEDIRMLQRQINHLEDEKSKLESYKAISLKLHNEFMNLEQKHTDYLQKSAKDQAQLQRQIECLVIDTADANTDRSYLERELQGMKDRIASVHRKTQIEMDRLNAEIDTINHERSVISDHLEESQRNVLKLAEENKYLVEQITKYQELFRAILPELTETQHQLLVDLTGS